MTCARTLLFALASACACVYARPARAADDLARARFLDQQGVRAYEDGRYHDAEALFREALRAGGPSTELWNVARCQLKTDDLPGAAASLRKYLARGDLGAPDRQEGERVLADLETRPSTFVVASEPGGATVYVDGTPVGTTPFSSTLAPGEHDVRVARADAPPYDSHLRAHDGGPVVMSVTLGQDGPTEHVEPRRGPRRFSVQLEAGPSISVHGGDGPRAFVGGSVAAGYSFLVRRSALLGAGLRVALTGDQWTTSPGVSSAITGCTPPADYAAAEVQVMPVLFGALRLGRLSLAAKLGVGLSAYSTGTPLGGDLFAPSCDATPGPVVDFYAGVEVSLPVSQALRVVISPLELDAHPAFDGARTGPVDASGAWLRFATTLGAAVDF